MGRGAREGGAGLDLADCEDSSGPAGPVVWLERLRLTDRPPKEAGRLPWKEEWGTDKQLPDGPSDRQLDTTWTGIMGKLKQRLHELGDLEHGSLNWTDMELKWKLELTRLT